MTDARIVRIELRVSDLERARAFYADCCGWQVGHVDTAEIRLTTGEWPEVALRVGAGTPSLVIAVDPKRAADVAANGGTVHGDGSISDPAGNRITLVAPSEDPPRGKGLKVTWLEVPMPEVAAGVRFYRRVFGWSFQVAPGTGEFAFFRDSRHVAGIGLLGGERARQVGHVHPYVTTDDFDLLSRRIVASGGALATPIGRGPDGGRFQIATDRDGNRFGLFEEPRR